MIVCKGDRELTKNFNFGNGTKFMVISFISTFNEPSNHIEEVILLITCATIVFSHSKLPPCPFDDALDFCSSPKGFLPYFHFSIYVSIRFTISNNY